LKRAVILAGGKGTRLRPYTVVLPKPLMPIGEEPILEVIVKQLAAMGFRHITMAVNHQAELIKAFFGDGSKWKVSIDYSLEEKPLGTMAPLKNITDLPENFLVMNGDVLTDRNFDEFYRVHSESGSIFTISSARRVQTIDYGVLRTDDGGRLTGFQEKPKTDYLVSMGVYMLNRRVLDFIPEDQHFGFDNLMYRLLDEGERVSVSVHEGLWLDIGRPDDYHEAIELFERERSVLLPS
jgi:NDP-sugar pyrophosphorylase family protein